MLCLDTLSVQSEHNQNTRSVRAEAGRGLVWGKFHAERARRRWWWWWSAARSGRVDASGAWPALDQLSGSVSG